MVLFLVIYEYMILLYIQFAGSYSFVLLLLIVFTAKSWIMKKRVAYVDCFSGIAGDMFLAALLNCGLNKSELIDHLRCALKNLLLWYTI
jgi:hypothetical protein